MNESSLPPQPGPREKLIDSSTSKIVKSGGPAAQAATRPRSSGVTAASTVHVGPIGENWEVENEFGTLGQAESKDEAEELAVRLAQEAGAMKVAIHGSDGSVVKEIYFDARKSAV